MLILRFLRSLETRLQQKPYFRLVLHNQDNQLKIIALYCYYKHQQLDLGIILMVDVTLTTKRLFLLIVVFLNN